MAFTKHPQGPKADWFVRSQRLGLSAPELARLTGTSLRNVRAYGYCQHRAPEGFLSVVASVLESRERRNAA